jgi:molybdate transport system substrate-binding protein
VRAVALVALCALAGCGAGSGSTGSPDGATGTAGPPDGATGTVTVLAAASLTEAFTTLGERFERVHPRTGVRFSFAASSELAAQVTQGAPADVFASASADTMAQVVDAGLAQRPAVFVRNRLAIAVPPDNPAGVTGLADLARGELTVALCAPEVPCGAAAERAFAAAGLSPAPDSLEQDVKAALTKVELGEVDAALVYRTDVRAAGDRVTGIDFPEAGAAVNDYLVAVLREAPNPAAARAFVRLVRSPAGARVLTAAGFERP